MVTAESMTLEVAAPPAGDMTATDEMSGDMGATEEMIAQPTVAPTEMAPTPEPVDFSTMTLPAEYGDYTIIVLSSVDAVVYVEPAAQ